MKTPAHKMIAHVAEEMAQQVYEEWAKDNDWYAANPDRNAIVKQLAPQLIPAARSALTDLLQRNDVSDEQKAEIFEALVLDQRVPRAVQPLVH